MDAATLTAIVAVPATIVSVGSAYWSTIKQRRTEDSSLTFRALELLVKTLQADNNDMRDRLSKAEVIIGDLRVQVAHCEADKDALSRQLNALTSGGT